jgi:hypothetical protein
VVAAAVAFGVVMAAAVPLDGAPHPTTVGEAAPPPAALLLLLLVLVVPSSSASPPILLRHSRPSPPPIILRSLASISRAALTGFLLPEDRDRAKDELGGAVDADAANDDGTCCVGRRTA